MVLPVQCVLDVHPGLVRIHFRRRGVRGVGGVVTEAVRGSATAQRAGGGMMHVVDEEGIQVIDRLDLVARVPRADERSLHNLGNQRKGVVPQSKLRFLAERRVMSEKGFLQGVFVSERGDRQRRERGRRIVVPWRN